MTDDRKGGAALIGGALGMLVTMGFHPSGHDLFAPGRFARAASLAAGVHALAIVSLAASFLGALALSRRLSSPDRLATAALVAFGFAAAAGMAAAAASGFVAPGIAREILASGPAAESWRIAFHYNGHLNQAFARILVVASSAAIALWSAAALRNRRLAPGVGVYGLVLGPAAVLLVASGHLRLDVHGFGLVVLGQSVWFVVAGVLLWRAREG